jgi:hypothetical protein
MTSIRAACVLAIHLSLASWASATCTRSFTPVRDGSFRDLFFEAATAMVALPDGGVLVAGKHYDDGAALARLDAQGRVDLAFTSMSSDPAIFGRVEAIVPVGRGFLLYGAFTDLMGSRSVGVFRVDADGRIDRRYLVAGWGEEPDGPPFTSRGWPGPLPSPTRPPTRQRADGAASPLFFAPAGLDAVALEPQGYDPSDLFRWPLAPGLARFEGGILLGGEAPGRVTGAHGLADGSWIVRGERSGPADDPVLLWRVGPAASRPFLAIRVSDLRAAVGVVPGILASAVLTDGSIVIGGTFTSVRGVPRRHIARLRPDGSLDR